MKKILLAAAAFVLAFSCKEPAPVSNVEVFPAEDFATTIQDKQVGIYTLTNANGMTVQLTNFGARVVALWVPSADGSFKDVVWGYPTIQGYIDSKDNYCGPVVGRYGNRIANGRFTLDGTEYQVTINENDNQLHGGNGGFWNRVWDAEMAADGRSVTMTYNSPDGEEGYPGNLTLSVTYGLTDDNEFTLDYAATTDAPTVLNPTSHCYFNLHGTTEASTDSHVLTIYASSFTPTDAELIPTGEIVPVEGTPLDFRTPTAIGERENMTEFEAIAFGGGYDHNWVLDRKRCKTGESCCDKGTCNKAECQGETHACSEADECCGRCGKTLAAVVYEPATGIMMKIITDQPGLQFYSGNGMRGLDTGKRGNKNEYRTGIALETQNFPDAPNHDNFPSSVLRPGEVYTHSTIYAFEVKKAGECCGKCQTSEKKDGECCGKCKASESAE